MPNYSYECKECSHTFEVFHSMSSSPEVTCPKCGAEAKKLIGTGGGVLFKGSGFYETDYKKKPKESKNKSQDSNTKSNNEKKS